MRRPSPADAATETEEQVEAARLDRLARLVRAGRALARTAEPDRRRALALVAEMRPLVALLDAGRSALAGRLADRLRARSAAVAYRRADRLASSPRRDRTP